MITNQDWQDTKEEFGDEAFRRFFVNDYYGTEHFKYIFEDNDHLAMCPEFEKIQFKPLPELLAHDVEVYGDNAYLMWEWICRDRIHTIETESNIELSSKKKSWNNVRRKTSASLPFDIERAKAGDVVEILTANGWKMCKLTINEEDLIAIFDTGFSTIFKNSLSELRMKYPPKAKK